MKTNAFISIILGAVLAHGCIGYEKGIPPHSNIHHGSAYVCGFFTMEIFYKKSIVAIIQNISTGKSYYILFSNNPSNLNRERSTLFPVEEGIYKLSAFMACPSVRSLFTIEQLDCTKRMPVDVEIGEQFAQPFSVKKGMITYIGTFRGQSYGINGGKSIQWRVNAFIEPEEFIQNSIRQQFSSIASMPIVSAFNLSSTK
ncbi:MAG: hypothetical protein N2316_09605 [Spirochaetes bacterium]|nr:hypothetical protein [Spirochaetota bacterium]